MDYVLNVSWIRNIGSKSIGRVNIIGVTMRSTEVGIKRGNRPGSMGDRQRSKSIGSATLEVDSRQYDRRSAGQRRDSSRPSYNMNQQRQEFHRAWQYGQDRQAGDWYDRHLRTYSRGAPPRREMQPSFFRGGWGASREKKY